MLDDDERLVVRRVERVESDSTPSCGRRGPEPQKSVVEAVVPSLDGDNARSLRRGSVGVEAEVRLD